MGKIAIATGVVTGVLGVTTIALAGVLVRDRRRPAAGAAALRRHGVFMGAAPDWRGGAHMTMGFRF